MNRSTGQAGLIIAEAIHQLARIAMLLLILFLAGICLLGFRLSAGPLALPYLAGCLATSASGGGILVRMDEADLAWAGYHQGGGVPLYLQLGGITVNNAAGDILVTIPRARLQLLPTALFGGNKAPILVSGSNAHFPGSDVPVSLTAQIQLGHHFSLAAADMRITLGPGRIGAGQMSVPITAGAFSLHLTPRAASLAGGVLRLAPSGASAPTITLSGRAVLNGAWQASLLVTADRVQAPDLPAYWPPPLLPLTRAWVVHNITAGSAAAGRFTFTLSSPASLASLSLIGVSGRFDGHGITLSWLDGAPPITGLEGDFVMPDRGEAIITGNTASLVGLSLQGGSFTITGMDMPRQTGHLQAAISGTIPAVLALLGGPPIFLLRAVPPQLDQATGSLTGDITATLPLIQRVRMADVDLRVAATLRDAAVPAPLPGIEITNGTAQITATGQGMSLTGTALLAGSPAQLSVQAKFGAGGGLLGGQIAATAGPALLHAAGLTGALGFLNLAGAPLPFTLTLGPDVAGSQSATINADLTPASLAIPHLGWTKPAGAPASLALTGTLHDGVPSAITSLNATAPGLDLAASAAGDRMLVSHLAIGRTRATGSITPPATPSGAWDIAFTGPRLDFRFIPKAPPGHEAAQPAAQAAPAPPSGPHWRLHFAFSQLNLAAAPAPPLQDFMFNGAGQGTALESGTGTAGGLNLAIAPAWGGGTAISLFSDNAGTLLTALGLFNGLQGGSLSLGARYGTEAPATGSLTLHNFRLSHAPAFTKVMQALTIYGVGAATSGPGLAFDTAIIPFTLGSNNIQLQGARAFSASLGFTASGTIPFNGNNTDLNCTIIPAYALNALPGEIPVIGHLFTAEKGGGLFAIRARLSGNITDPQVSINPLSALTPGALRGLFGMTEK